MRAEGAIGPTYKEPVLLHIALRNHLNFRAALKRALHLQLLNDAVVLDGGPADEAIVRTD